MKSFNQFVAEATKVEVKHSDVVKALSTLDKKIVGKDLTPAKIKTMFTKPLNSVVMCDVSMDKSPAVSPNTLNVTAFFDETVEEDDWEYEEYQFEFILIFNPDDTTVSISKDYWTWFKAELADAIVHEMLHRGQARSRGYKEEIKAAKFFKNLTKDQKYYARNDEIEAYALNAALELKRSFKNVRAAQKALNYATKIDKQAPSIKRYIEQFQSPAHPVMKAFLKKVYTYLNSDI